MKKLFFLILALSVLTFSSASAHGRDHKDGPPSRHDERWQDNHQQSEHNMPFQWHERRDHLSSDHHLERIREKEFKHRFPGLHAYQWHHKYKEGFWYKGHFINDAVLFYNDSDELIQIGYMHDGIFIVIMADHSSHEHRDSFFQTWWQHRN